MMHNVRKNTKRHLPKQSPTELYAQLIKTEQMHFPASRLRESTSASRYPSFTLPRSSGVMNLNERRRHAVLPLISYQRKTEKINCINFALIGEKENTSRNNPFALICTWPTLIYQQGKHTSLVARDTVDVLIMKRHCSGIIAMYYGFYFILFFYRSYFF